MLKKAHRDLAAAQRQLWKLQKEVSRGVTGVIVFILHCLDYLAYVEEFYKTQITTAMQIGRNSQYHYYINEHRSWNVVEKYAMQKNRKNDYIFPQ